MYLPYLLGERSPRWNPDARAGFVGIGMEHGKGDFLRAVQEGVALNLNVVLDTFRKNGQDIREMVVVGGGAKSLTWQQILADVYGVKIQVPALLDEAASMGAAITAGVGVGLFRDFNEADRFLEICRNVEPREAEHTLYRRTAPVFDEAYHALEPVYRSLKSLR